MKKIVSFHLYNDFSGSPKVLMYVLQKMLTHGYNVSVLTSKHVGILSQLRGNANFKLYSYRYVFSENPLIEIVKYCSVQFFSLFWSFKYVLERNTVFYVNTILPVGAAIAGRIMCKKVIYHYHENANAKGLVYKILCNLMELLASDIICVSDYQKSFLKRKNKVYVIPNALPENWILEPKSLNSEVSFNYQTILMLSSLKGYKGTYEFIKLATDLYQYQFILVINDTEANISHYLNVNEIKLPKNLKIYSKQNDVRPFYKKSSIVLNLSNKFYCVETFGLTALEAMSFGLPVIVPTVGGIAEIVADGVNGYKIDVQNLDKIKERINILMSDVCLYKKISANALSVSHKYSLEKQVRFIENIIES